MMISNRLFARITDLSILAALLGAFLANPLHAQTVSGLFKKVNSAVVVIRTEETVISPATGFEPATKESIGSGVLIEPNRVLTSAHVVEAANLVRVSFADDHETDAKILGSSPLADVALLELKQPPKGVSPVELGDSDSVEVGDRVFVVGAPYGLSHTLTVGYISGRISPGDIAADLTYVEYLQTDAAINEGNSGGPLFNMKGQVVGIVSSIVTRSGGSEGLGFAVASNAAREVLLEREPFWIGMEGRLLNPKIADLLNVPQETGLLVRQVADGSPAERAGLRPGYIPVEILGEPLLLGGDIILKIGDTEVGSMPGEWQELQRRFGHLKPGGRIPVEVLREGEIVQLELQH